MANVKDCWLGGEVVSEVGRALIGRCPISKGPASALAGRRKMLASGAFVKLFADCELLLGCVCVCVWYGPTLHHQITVA